MFLKLKNEPILEFQRDEGFYKIIEPERLPFGLRNMLIDFRKVRMMIPFYQS